MWLTYTLWALRPSKAMAKKLIIKPCKAAHFQKLVRYLLEYGNTLFEDNYTVVVSGWWYGEQYTISFIDGVAVSYIFASTLVLPEEVT